MPHPLFNVLTVFESRQYKWVVATLSWDPDTGGGAAGGGDASAANQTTEIARLTSILADVDKIPSQGQALAAASTPVVLTAIQQAALTPPAAIAGFALEAGHLAAIDTSTAKIPALGQAVAGSSVPVVLPAAQITTLTPIAGNLEATQLLVKAKTDNLDALLSTRLKPADTLAAVTSLTQMNGVAIALNTGVRAAGVQRVTIATDDLVPVSLPTLTKGTQGGAGASTQDLKDAGRNMTNYFMAAVVATTNAEVMQSLTGYKGGVAVGATVTPAVVTAGKTYRIQSVEITLWAVTAIGGALVRLRANLTGAGVVGSPLVKVWQIGIPAIFTAGSAMTYTFDYPDGLEFPAGTGIAVGVVGEAADGTTATAIGKILVAINGYEY